jgi:PAS domain-containing protein
MPGDSKPAVALEPFHGGPRLTAAVGASSRPPESPVTGRVEADIERGRVAELALGASEERFRLMVESVQDYAILMLSPEGNVTTWNAGAERIKGYRAEEIIGPRARSEAPRDDGPAAASKTRSPPPACRETRFASRSPRAHWHRRPG